MAKVGLNFGEKKQIVDKSYRVLNDALVDLKKIFGKIIFVDIQGQDIIYQDDTSQPRRQDGTYPQISTGEVRGVVIGVLSSNQPDSLYVTVTDQFMSDIEALGLKYNDEVEFENLIITYSSVGNNQFKLFADSIKRVGGGQPQVTAKPNENKEKQDHKG